MGTLNDRSVADGNQYVLAAYYNLLLGSILRKDFSNAVTMSGDLELTDGDYAIQRLDCNGADRVVKVPPSGDGNHPFLMINVTGAGSWTLTVKSNDAVTAYAVLTPGYALLILPDGNGAYAVAGGINSLIDQSVTTAKLMDLCVTTAKINDLAVTTGKINDGAVSSAKISEGAVTPAQNKIQALVALSDASVTLTASQLVDSGLFTITPTVARDLTLPLATDIIAALPGYQVGTWFDLTFVVKAAFVVTLLTNTGLTLHGSMAMNNVSGSFRCLVTSATTVAVFRK